MKSATVVAFLAAVSAASRQRAAHRRHAKLIACSTPTRHIPVLRFHRLKARPLTFWSVRVTRDYRAVGFSIRT